MVQAAFGIKSVDMQHSRSTPAPLFSLSPSGPSMAKHQARGNRTPVFGCKSVLEYTIPTPILSPATLVTPQLEFLESSKAASSKGDFSTGLLWPSWGKTEEGPTHSPIEATSWGYQAWSGLVTTGPILFSVTGALAGGRPKECPSPIQCVSWGWFCILRGV